MISFIINWKPETRADMDLLDAKHKELHGTTFGYADAQTGKIAMQEVAKDIYHKKVTFISSAITLHFANAGISDTIDLMRCNMFGQRLAEIALDETLSIKEAYNTTEYCSLPCSIDKLAMQEIIDKVNKLKDM